MKQGGGSEEGAMFAQSVDDSWKNNITCHKCGKKGHFTQECCSKGDGEKPKSNENNQVHANVDKDNDNDNGENLFIQHKKSKKGVVNKNYLLLDNQSTVNQVAIPNLLKNIRKSKKPIIVHCNVGSTKNLLDWGIRKVDCVSQSKKYCKCPVPQVCGGKAPHDIQ